MKLLEALAAGATLLELGQPFATGMTAGANSPGFRSALLRRHGDHIHSDGVSAATEIVTMGTHVGTHIDASCHISADGRLHGGADAAQAQRGGAFASGSVDQIPPLITRGVLLDVAAAHGVDSLPAWQAITADDLDRAERHQGVSAAAGNVVCIRTGWGAHFADGPRYLGSATGVPGLDETAARWLVARGATAAGTDTWAFEHVPSGGVPERLPVHRILLFEHRVHLLENLNLEEVAATTATEFVFVGLPLRIVGATGSPLRPVAVLS